MGDDSSIRAVALDVHSYGGEVYGCFDLADKIHAFKAKYGKPVWAIVDECAYSAAYCLVSQADRIIVPRTGGVGSVGVVMMHTDLSAALELEGVKITFIHAGAHKVDGNPFEPLPEAVRAEWQAEIMSAYKLFTGIVARGRKMDVAAVEKTEARCYSADEAKAIGFVDDIMPASDAFDALAAELSKPRTFSTAARAASAKAKGVSKWQSKRALARKIARRANAKTR
jgi:signal peptide peptidase SppA